MQYSLGPLLRRRGPDTEGVHRVEVGGGTTLHLEGTVLHMRGPLTAQPLLSNNGDAMLWNGEVFAGMEVWEFRSRGLHPVYVTLVLNDSVYVLRWL